MTVSRAAYERALDRMEPIIRAAFIDAIGRMTSRASISRLQDALVAGNIDQILRAAGYSPGLLAGLEEALRAAYIEGGTLIAAAAPAAVAFDFSPSTARARAWLSVSGSELVTEITESIRAVINDLLQEGLVAGQNPRTTGLNLVGRINPTTGRRAGGIIGLTQKDAAAVRRAKRQLASGDPTQMAGYFGRERRDKRFDRLVARAIQAGQPVAAGDVERIAARYADRLLALRGETISRTETLQAVNAAQGEAIQQAIEQRKIDQRNVTKVWRTAADSRVRSAHSVMNGDAKQQEEAFQSGTGALLRWPGDRSLGAGGEDVINCRCQAIYRVDWIAEEIPAR